MQTSFCCSGVRYCSGVGGFIPWLSLQRLYLAERLRGHRRHPPAGAAAGTGSAEGSRGKRLFSGCRGVQPRRQEGQGGWVLLQTPLAQPAASAGRWVHERSREQAGTQGSRARSEVSRE